METDIEKALASVEIIDGTEIRARWARKFINDDGAEVVSWHRASFSVGDPLPSDVQESITNGTAISRQRRRSSADDAADFLARI